MSGGGVVRLTRRLVLEARESAPDGSGGQVSSWRALGALWADLAPRSGREDFVGGRASPRQGWRILVRGAPPGAASRPVAGQRLREGERVFRILSVAEHDPEGRYLVLTADEGVLR